MSAETPLPFDRGATLGVSSTSDGTQHEGKVVWFDDKTYGLGPIKLRCVRNVSGIALQSKRLVTFQTGYLGKRVDGYADVASSEHCYPVDDAYGSVTIANNDLFWIVEDGPCLIKTALPADATNLIPEGSFVVCATAATSQATTAGRIRAIDTAAATTLQLEGLLNHVGRALTARTTANTNTDTLVYVRRAW